MREIKYRGKRMDNGEWVEGFYGYKEATKQHVIMVETINYYFSSSYFTDYTVDPETVGQYTGLTDQTGREMYEGDIFSIGDQLYIVVFEDGAFWSLWKRDKSRCLLHGHVYVSEIVGNIHENPELLEATHE